MPIYTSTTAFLQQQLANFKNASDINLVTRAAAVETVSLVFDRVTQEGKKSNGTQIGKYSNNVYKSSKRKAKSFASKKRYATLGANEGYRDLRQKLGMNVQFIDFLFSGDMFKSWRAVPVSNVGWGVLFDSKKQRAKAESLEARFGQVFSLSKPELTRALQIIEMNALKYLLR